MAEVGTSITPADRREKRFWKLYREERKKFGPFKKRLSSAQIVHAARTARTRLDAETTNGPSEGPSAPQAG